jgi:hypothetical protein
MVVHRHGEAEAGKRVTEGGLARHDGDHRLKTGVEETARGFPHEQLTPVRLE